MSYQLNRKAQERLKALVRAEKYVDQTWAFSAADSNAMLGDPPNWTEYANWFLGIDETQPEGTKERYAYPYGKADKVYLSTLRAIASRASAEGSRDVADAASAALSDANQQVQQKAQATRRP